MQASSGNQKWKFSNIKLLKWLKNGQRLKVLKLLNDQWELYFNFTDPCTVLPNKGKWQIQKQAAQARKTFIFSLLQSHRPFNTSWWRPK